MARRPNSSQQTLALLTVLLESPKTWRHGYDLSKETELKSGTLYPLLMRLADQGLLESEWETAEESSRPRHIYRLTRGGIAFAKEQLASCAPATNVARLIRGRA